MNHTTRPTILVLTVGMGQPENTEGSLYHPMLVSIEKGGWTHLVLLPSATATGRAREIAHRIEGPDMTVRPLAHAGMEDQLEDCLAFFVSVIRELQKKPGASPTITADFTRGTKTMSVALALSAARCRIHALRYTTNSRDADGTVLPGTVQICEERLSSLLR